MDYISQTILVTLSSGFIYVSVLFFLQLIYCYMYDNNKEVPRITFHSFVVFTSLILILLSILMLLPDPLSIVSDNWPGITAPTIFIDVVYVISNKSIYTKQHIIFFLVHHGILLAIIIVFTITLKLEFMTISIIPWCLLWNGSSIIFASYGIFNTHNNLFQSVVNPVLNYHRYITIMIIEHLWRTTIYPFLILFNIHNVGPVSLGLVLALILQVFELYGEILTARALYNKMLSYKQEHIPL